MVKMQVSHKQRNQQKGGYIPLNEDDIKEINAALGSDSEIWMTTRERAELNSLDQLKESLKSRYRRRREAIDSLMVLHTLVDGEPKAKRMVNLDFISNFYRYFHIGNKDALGDLCGLFSSTGATSKSTSSHKFRISRVLASGAVGTAYLLEAQLNNGHEGTLIVKEIRGIKRPGKYLPLFFSHFHPGVVRLHAVSRYVELNANLAKKIDAMSPGYFKINGIANDTPGEHILVSCPNDNFTNQTIMHMIIEAILSAYGCENFLYQYDAFFCRQIGYLGSATEAISGFNITEFANGGTLDRFINEMLKESNARDNDFQTGLFNKIFSDVFTALSILKQPQYAFIHGDLKSKNVLVQVTKPMDQITTKEDIDKHVIFKIADFDKSSITWHKIRFHNDATGSTVANVSSQLTNHRAYLNQAGGPHYSIEDWFTFFKAQYPSLPATEIEQIGIRYLPYPFYGSIDIYTLVLSMLTNAHFVKYVNNSVNVDTPVVKMLKQLFLRYTDGFSSFVAIFDAYIKSEKANLDLDHTGDILEIAKKNSIEFRRDIEDIYPLFGVSVGVSVEKLNQSRVIRRMQLSSHEYKMCTGQCGEYRKGHVAATVNYAHVPQKPDDLGGEIIHFQPRLSLMSRYPESINKTCSTNMYSSRSLLTGSILLDYDTCEQKSALDDEATDDPFVELYDPDDDELMMVPEKDINLSQVRMFRDEDGKKFYVAKTVCDSIFDALENL